ncbi:MAG: hypothetical protein AMR96_01515 [Candidatus Adiutrix intracellularis]|jgi:GTP-binding protein Era|nr:MAG: hypothetical protein AMR96_01515 [Candidatus Adiutrix intracellularis]MDR2827316.1 GTPase Era [Candidatus Adiutrix intracellularis]
MTSGAGYRAGFTVIAGAPNAGKSTLLNYLLGEKVAIVTSKPQTTRHRILGVLTRSDAQLIFWDTPGLHDPGRTLLNREMMSRALAALADSDVILWVVDGLRRGAGHATAVNVIRQNKNRPLIVAINKIDAAPNKSIILPLIREIEVAVSPRAIIPISARTGDGVNFLVAEIKKNLPVGLPLYSETALTDQPERVIAAEMVREAVFNLTSCEIPYATAVTIDAFETGIGLIRLSVTIHLERESQKGIIIGQGGLKLKQIGQAARLNIERLVGEKVFLKIFVCITRDWTQKKSTLLDFGYGDK